MFALPRHWLGFGLIASLFTVNVYRAHTQSITHDEAYNYARFVAKGWTAIRWAFEAGNHTLHSYLVKLSTDLLGVSHLSIRLPALLGGLLYLLAVERLCRWVFERRGDYLLGLALLTTSPFVLDYLVAARGYSLALGFFMLAFLVAFTQIRQPASSHWALVFLSCLCALSVASNLAFAFVNVSLLGVVLLSNGRRVLSLLVPGAVLYLLINPAILDATPDPLRFGSPTWGVSYFKVSEAVFDDFDKLVGWGISTTWVSWLPWLIGLSLIYGALLVGRSVRKGRDLLFVERLWLGIGAVLVGTLTLHTLAHLVYGLPLPQERTGLFLVPLVLLLACLPMALFSIGILSQGGVRVILASVVVYFLASTHLDYFRKWQYDAGAQAVFERLQAMDADYGAGIGINGKFEPSLNFYRSLANDPRMPVFTRTPPTDAQTYFVLLPYWHGEQAFIDQYSIQPVFHHPVSRAMIGVKPPHPLASAPAP